MIAAVRMGKGVEGIVFVHAKILGRDKYGSACAQGDIAHAVSHCACANSRRRVVARARRHLYGVGCGGGAKSPLWKKMIANILNLKVDVIEVEEGPSLGGAMLAAVACGEFANVEEAAAKIVKVVDTVEPDPQLVEKYDQRYAQFKEIYPACKPLFEIIK